MKIAAIDDDKATLYILKKMLLKIPDTDSVETFQNVYDLEKYLLYNKVDLIFVDIKIMDEDGLVCAKKMKDLYPEMIIIFLTSHAEYALEAFDVYALDYIIKPISEERLYKTIEQAKRYITKSEEKSYLLYIYCLGGCDVKDSCGTTIKFLSSKSEELFLYLLSYNDRTVNKWKIIDDLFPEMPISNAEIYLNTTIYKLRKVLQAADVKDIIISSNGGYVMNSSGLYIDYTDFNNKISIIDHRQRNWVTVAIEIEQLFDGELYGEKDYKWSYFNRERLTNSYTSFAKGLCSYIILENMPELMVKALNILKKLEALDELDQETACLIMKVYTELRDKAALEKYYSKFCKTLKKELGIAPDASLIKEYRDSVKNFK